MSDADAMTRHVEVSSSKVGTSPRARLDCMRRCQSKTRQLCPLSHPTQRYCCTRGHLRDAPSSGRRHSLHFHARKTRSTIVVPFCLFSLVFLPPGRCYNCIMRFITAGPKVCAIIPSPHLLALACLFSVVSAQDNRPNFIVMQPGR